MRQDTIKFLEKNIGKTLSDINNSNVLQINFPSGGKKAKNKQMRVNQSKELHNK